MNKQISLGDYEYQGKRKKTKKEVFLEQMDGIVPWVLLRELVEPFYYQGGRGRPPIELELMLRMYMVSLWFSLSDEATEDMVIENQSVRQFVGVSLASGGSAPDATTLLHFRHLLEKNQLAQRMNTALTERLMSAGVILKQGTIVDATIISAASSTKNKTGKRDPEMASTKKGNNYSFGMKAHIGVDSESGLVHTVKTTAANVHDITMAHELLHGEEETLGGDSGYLGVEKRGEFQDTKVKSFLIAKRPSQLNKLADNPYTRMLKDYEKYKSRLRAKVEHPFHIVKNIFAHKRVRYKGLSKNTHQLNMLFMSANLYKLRLVGLS